MNANDVDILTSIPSASTIVVVPSSFSTSAAGSTVPSLFLNAELIPGDLANNSSNDTAGATTTTATTTASDISIVVKRESFC